MKPRPNVLPLSDEDTALWHLVVTRFYARIDLPTQAFTGLWAGSLAQGRRDADLILHLAELRASGDCYLRMQIGVHWCNVIVPAVQVYVRKNPLWPAPAQL